MLRLALKGALGHKGRLLLMAMAIVLGVAFIAGSYVFTDTMKAAFDVLFEQETNVDVVVRADVQFGFDSGRVPASLVETVEGVSGVERVLPSVQGMAQPLDKDGEPIGGFAPNLAFSWSEAEAELTEVTLREGRAPEGPGEVAIDAFTAEKHGFALGDPISILLPNTVGEFTVVGTAGYGTADNLLGATIVLFDLQTAQVALNFGENYSQLAVIAAPGARGGQVCHGLAELVDLYPTVADYCGLTAPHQLAGQSLRPLLEDPSRPGKEAAFTLVTRGAGQSGQSVRTQRWRYTRWSDGTAELYDHQADPEETRDVAADPAYADLVRSHARLLDALPPLRQ